MLRLWQKCSKFSSHWTCHVKMSYHLEAILGVGVLWQCKGKALPTHWREPNTALHCGCAEPCCGATWQDLTFNKQFPIFALGQVQPLQNLFTWKRIILKNLWKNRDFFSLLKCEGWCCKTWKFQNLHNKIWISYIFIFWKVCFKIMFKSAIKIQHFSILQLQFSHSPRIIITYNSHYNFIQ